MSRRELLRGLGVGAVLLSLPGCAARRRRASAATVVVVGGGYGGATAAKYLRLLSGNEINVVLIEPNLQFISSPLSNLVVAGQLELSDITRSYDELHRRHGVRIIHERCTGIDAPARTLRLERGGTLRFDRLVLAPGIEPMSDSVDGLVQARLAGRALSAWMAGPETVALHAQLAAMPDGGVFAITIPEAPYRCPPAPYERACLVADYFRNHKPRSKVLVLDANQDVVAMGALFKGAWRERYDGLLEYRNHYNAVAVDAKTLTVSFDVQADIRADVLNILPPVRAGALAINAGLANVNSRWCEVNFLTFESTAASGVHIIGDAVHAAPMMPKSGHMANAHAKVAASAIVAGLLEQPLNDRPMLTNACYSFVNSGEVIHSAAVYAFDHNAKTFMPVAAAGGTSAAPSALEATYARAWARNVWADVLS
jgi:NADPH-dependent 2,4-dienoyl-CoA reductase/sulfur reductase-like enzyme